MKQITKAAKSLLKTNKINLINKSRNAIVLRIKGKNHTLNPGEHIKSDGYTAEIRRLLRQDILGIYNDPQ